MIKRQSIGRNRAIELYDVNWWKLCDYRDIAKFQLFTEELCCPFSVFHRAVEKSLDRTVPAHEFGTNTDGLCSELLGDSEAPTMDEMIELIPESKRIVLIRTKQDA